MDAITPLVKERPIIFSAAMVRAILEGRKTQTRRIVKGRALEWLDDSGFTPEYVSSPENGLCPYGKPGDRLWVRETFSLETAVEDEAPPHSDGRPLLRRPEDDFDGYQPLWTQPHYNATDPARDLCCEREGCAICRDHDCGPHWKPSIHMPRWASRILLEVVSVRVERLSDILEADARAEGISREGVPEDVPDSVVFNKLWDDIHGVGAFEMNPWLWVVEFKRVNAHA